jgi:hypothetical protein
MAASVQPSFGFPSMDLITRHTLAGSVRRLRHVAKFSQLFLRQGWMTSMTLRFAAFQADLLAGSLLQAFLASLLHCLSSLFAPPRMWTFWAAFRNTHVGSSNDGFRERFVVPVERNAVVCRAVGEFGVH